MSADPTLTLGWLVLAHLLADFVFQTDGIAFAKASAGIRAWYGLVAHAGFVAVLLVPFAFAFGPPGLAVVVLTAVSHGLIDRAKIVLTRRAEAAAIRSSRRSHEVAPGSYLGVGWSPVPAALFALDQVVHLAVAGLLWAVFLANTAPTDGWQAAVGAVTAAWGAAGVHAATLTGVVLVSLAIANIRGAAFFVETLVHPRQATASMSGGSADSPRSGATGHWPALATPAADPGTDQPGAGPAAAGGTPGRVPGSDVPPPRTVTTALVRRPRSPERVGATIGVLERLLIVTFILTANGAAVGFVIAAKTVARFRQLDDRDFAEYYLLGTLGSVSVAIATGLIAAAALATIPA